MLQDLTDFIFARATKRQGKGAISAGTHAQWSPVETKFVYVASRDFCFSAITKAFKNIATNSYCNY